MAGSPTRIALSLIGKLERMPFATADGPVLITQSQLTRLAGSEMVVMELVDHLTARGNRVIVVTHALGEDAATELARSGLVDVRLSDDPDLDALLTAAPPIYAWIQHQLVPDALLTGAVSGPVVFAHLSAQLPIEFPLSPAVEGTLGTVIAFNSDETLALQKETGILDSIDDDRIMVLGNPAPDAFATETTAVAREGGAPTLLVVSNHIPDEVLEAVDLLGDRFAVRLVGRELAKGAEPTRVRPATIHDADAVLTIGKTVQYALMAGRPVYCYDHFGGPGWLDDDNVGVAQRHNFSGRGFSTRSAEQIAEELASGLEEASAWARERQPASAAEFGLTARLGEVEARLEAWKPGRVELPTDTVAAFIKQRDLIRRVVVDWTASVVRGERLEENIRSLREGEARARDLLDERSASLDRMTTSRDESREHARKVEALLDGAKQRMASLEADRSRFLQELAAASRERVALRGELESARAESESQREELERATSSLAWKISERARRLGKR